MATEQIVELFALDGAEGPSEVSSRPVNKSKKKEGKGPFNVDDPESWDIEELWNHSQVGCLKKRTFLVFWMGICF